jgi:Ca-activated chloride channel homolog
MTDVTYDDLRWLNLLWLALLAAAAGAYGIWQRRRALRLFGDASLTARLASGSGLARGLLRTGMIAAALACLTFAIVGPRWGQVEQRLVQRGIDVMVVLDVSRSMLARDIAPNRLQRAVLSLSDDLLPALGGDRVGLITFAGVPTLKCPLTNDYGFFRLALEDVSTNSSPRGGTLIGDALRKAATCFDKTLDTHRLVLLITDGEDHESFPVEAAKALWNDEKIPVVAVALGDEAEGARIPVEAEGGSDYLKHKGQTVWSKANFSDLRAIAAASQLNAFVPVGTKNFDLGEIYRKTIIPVIQYKQREESQTVQQPSQFHPFALAALLLVFVESLLRDGPGRPDRDVARNVQRRAA